MSEQLSNNFRQTAITLNRLKSVCSDLSRIHSNHNSRTQVGNTFPNQTLYQDLSRTFGKWSQFVIKQTKNINENLVENLRFTKKEINCVDELIDIRTRTGILYYSNWKSLESKKMRLFKSGYTKDWKLNLKGTGLSKGDVVNNETLSKFLMLPKVKSLIIFSKRRPKIYKGRDIYSAISTTCCLISASRCLI